LVQENGASDRTIGVITKCDTIQERDEEKVEKYSRAPLSLQLPTANALGTDI
jgi:hypothetical protein